MESKKSSLVDILNSKAIACVNKARILKTTDAANADVDAVLALFDTTYKELSKWENVNTSDRCWRICLENHKRGEK